MAQRKSPATLDALHISTLLALQGSSYKISEYFARTCYVDPTSSGIEAYEEAIEIESQQREFTAEALQAMLTQEVRGQYLTGQLAQIVLALLDYDSLVPYLMPLYQTALAEQTRSRERHEQKLAELRGTQVEAQV